jgi:hypothetical protein
VISKVPKFAQNYVASQQAKPAAPAASPAPIAPKMGAMGAQAMPLAANNLRAPVMGSGNIAPGAPRMMGGMKKGGKVSSASKRADGIAQRGKTRGMMK